MGFHKLAKAKDKRFWSVRVSSDLRLIVHRTADSLLLCYVGHHDQAYAWAERRKLETHPATGAAQLVEIRERIQEIVVPLHVQSPPTLAPKAPVLGHVADEELLGYGVPAEWLADAAAGHRGHSAHLGGPPAGGGRRGDTRAGNGGGHPGARRRFRVMTDVDELARALEYPWERWTVFLHAAQRDLVERRFGGPARIAGSAGTGKTVVALHRAAHLARANPDLRILLTTFSETLASALRTKLARLIGTEPRLRERVDVDALDTVASRLHDRMLGRAEVATRDVVRDLLREATLESVEPKFSPAFLLSEWNEVVDAWQLASWEAYRDVARLGRKTRLPEKQRHALWAIFQQVRSGLSQRGLVTQADLYSRLATRLVAGERRPYDFVVVDVAQDVSVAQLRFVTALGGGRPDTLFFAGDIGQRIFRLPFSWLSLGVDIRGRSGTLRINYRTSHQIRMQADRLLGRQLSDVDGNTEERGGTISVFNGPAPLIRVFDSAEGESAMVGRWLAERASEGVTPGEMMACDDEVLTLQAPIGAVADEGDLEEVYDTERHLLYVACTRARDHLLVTGIRPASEFLDDLLGSRPERVLR